MCRFPALLLSLLPLALPAAPEIPYHERHAVVISHATAALPGWQAVADALVDKHRAALIHFEEEVESCLPELQRLFPKYVTFVATPEEAGYAWTVRTHRLMRQLDGDPYTDALFATLTGPNPEVALRIARGTEPRTIRTALLTAGVGPERFQEARFISEHEKGLYGHRTPDGITDTTRTDEPDLTPVFIDALERLDPDIVLTSSHASQRNLEMPFGQGNIVSQGGQLYGFLTRDRLIRDDGFAKEGPVVGERIPVKPLHRPKIFFAVGNCLIGDIPDRDCMALAWMDHGLANQLIGYTTTTWFGMAGWNTLKIWERSGGTVPLNEAFFFAQQGLLWKLDQAAPGASRLSYPTDTMPSMQQLAQTLARAGHPVSQSSVGMLWDRDVVAFYGDPALEARLDPDHTVPATHSLELTEADGVFTLVLTCHEAFGTPDLQTPPLGIWLPRRLGPVEILEGDDLSPVITDAFVLLPQPGPWAAGSIHTLSFSGTLIRSPEIGPQKHHAPSPGRFSSIAE
jgi:zinc protease